MYAKQYIFNFLQIWWYWMLFALDHLYAKVHKIPPFQFMQSYAHLMEANLSPCHFLLSWNTAYRNCKGIFLDKKVMIGLQPNPNIIPNIIYNYLNNTYYLNIDTSDILFTEWNKTPKKDDVNWSNKQMIKNKKINTGNHGSKKSIQLRLI